MDGEERPRVLRLSLRFVVVAGGTVGVGLGRVCVAERLALFAQAKLGRLDGNSSGGSSGGGKSSLPG